MQLFVTTVLQTYFTYISVHKIRLPSETAHSGLSEFLRELVLQEGPQTGVLSNPQCAQNVNAADLSAIPKQTVVLGIELGGQALHKSNANLRLPIPINTTYKYKVSLSATV